MKRDFVALDSGLSKELAESLNSEEDESRRKGRRGNSKKANAHTNRGKGKKKVASNEDLESMAREFESDIGKLTAKVEEYRQRLKELTSENEKLKQRLTMLESESGRDISKTNVNPTNQDSDALMEISGIPHEELEDRQ